MTTWAGIRKATHRAPNPASVRGLAAAMAELTKPAPTRSEAALLAEREQLAQRAHAQRTRQACLPLQQGE